MRAVIQRVTSASVTVDSEVISRISRGLMILVGIGTDDGASDVEVLSKKILSLRVFSDSAGTMWKSSVKDIDGENFMCFPIHAHGQYNQRQQA